MKSETDTQNSSEDLVKLLYAFQQKIESQAEEINHLKNQNQSLLEHFKLAKQRRFGRSSEKNVDQLNLFDEAELGSKSTTKDEEVSETQTVTYERKKPKRSKLPEDLPREIIEVDLKEEDKQCDCGCAKKRIGEEVTEKLEFVPAQVKVLAYVRPKYACNKCDQGVSVAKLPPLFLPKSIATPSLVAQTIVSKYEDHLPLYRQENIWQRHGIRIPRNTACDWVMAAYELCKPMVDVLIKQIRESFYNQADETPLLVMGEPDRKNTSKSYMWVYRSMEVDKPVVLFDYRAGRGAVYPKEILSGFKGYLQTDCYKGYDWAEEDDDINQLACMAHGRRPFAEIVKISKKKGKSHKILALIRKLYSIEKRAKDKSLSHNERYKLRQSKAVPVLEELKNDLEAASLTAVPESKFGKAVSYMRKHWSKLIKYIDDGRLEIDNNGAENKIRPFAVGRKNWMISGSPRGANAASLFYSLIATAKNSELQPFKYLTFLFENIIHCKTEDDYIALLPFNCKDKI